VTGGWLPFVWLVLIALAIFMYVLLDGFVLGTGLLFPFAKSEDDRSTMMMSVAPIWDANETWLVLGAGGLFAVFPLAYSIVLPAL
jgi:cytochrome d ubiquinol oxidase subunit II